MAAKFIDATPSFNGLTFKFRLTREVLEVGLPQKVTYYAMHGSQFRESGGGVNFRPVVDSWWAAMHEGASPNRDDYLNRVWAEAYRVVNTARSMQDVYLDAYLSKQIDRDYTLPADEMHRLHKLVHRGPLSNVQPELESLFLGEIPSTSDQEFHDERAGEWLDDGMVALRNLGEEGLQRWLTKIEQRIAQMRRRGGADRDRDFVNLFSYEAKASFHLCFANTWVKLIPWLRENHGLDPISERFMWLMHRLNREGDIPGLTAEQRRGTLCGQVLSLHPISRFLAAQSNHRKVLGLWIGHSDYDAICQDAQRMATCPEYLNVVAMILCAAHEYKHSREQYEQQRGVRTISGNSAAGDRPSLLDHSARDDVLPDIASRFNEYALMEGIRCPRCDGPVKYFNFCRKRGRPEHQNLVIVTFDCSQGHAPFEHRISLEQFSGID